MDSKTSISFLINKLQDLLPDGETTNNITNTNTKASFRKQVQAAIENLHDLKQFLQSSSGDSVSDHRIDQILKAVCFIDDATDTLLIKKEPQEIRRRRGIENGFRRFKSLVSFSSQVLFTRKMNKFNNEVRRFVEMKGDFSSDVGDIGCNNIRRLLSFENGSSQHCQLQQGERPCGGCLGDETNVFGFERQINELVVQLIPQQNLNNGHSSEFIQEVPCEQDPDQSTKVIALVGEGGSGKTTLARTVYDRVDVKRHFVKRAWVRIPSVFKARDVLANILQQINQVELELADILSEDALMWGLTKLLCGTRFLIVLEDVETPQVWESSLNWICSSSQFCGKLIITTCNANNLPPKVCNLSVTQLCRLNEEESWKLFLEKVRIAEVQFNRSELIMLKELILKICGGLPSQIVLLGGLLSAKEQSYEEWSRVIVQANDAKRDIMASTFQDLPSEVKPCFLYMGLFPKGFEIPVRRLIHLWRAEKFVMSPDSEETDPEALAETFFEELVIRNMIQVRWKLDGS